MKNNLLKILIVGFLSLSFSAIANADVSCYVADNSCNNSDVEIFRMFKDDNAHAEFAGQGNYSKVVCCGGAKALLNSCDVDDAVIIVKLAKSTNSHIELPTENNYANNLCVSATNGADITVGYQANNCDGYDTTLFSMFQFSTNSHIGDAGAYPNKVCLTVKEPTIYGWLPQFFSRREEASRGEFPVIAVKPESIVAEVINNGNNTESSNVTGFIPFENIAENIIEEEPIIIEEELDQEESAQPQMAEATTDQRTVLGSALLANVIDAVDENSKSTGLIFIASGIALSYRRVALRVHKALKKTNVA